MQIRSIATSLLALGATALLLTGCSQQATNDHAAKKPSASATAPDGVEKPAYDNACDGKQAVLSGDGGSHKLKDCDAVSIVSSGSSITIGDTKSVIVEGSNNDVTVASSDSVTFLGANNKVHVGGETPAVVDQGSGNTVD